MDNNIIREKVKQYLNELGFNPSLKGYKYWTTAIIYAVYQEKLGEELMKLGELYKYIGKLHKATATKVERDMRYILGINNLKYIFKTDYSISNSAFLYLSQEIVYTNVC